MLRENRSAYKLDIDNYAYRAVKCTQEDDQLKRNKIDRWISKR